MPRHLRLRNQISYRAARALLVDMALHADHRSPRMASEESLFEWFAGSRTNVQLMIAHCRNFSNTVPDFENMASGTFWTGHGASVSILDEGTGETIADGGQDGVVAQYDYLAHFRLAFERLRTVVDQPDLTMVGDFASNAVTSIESYLRYRARIWNTSGGEPRLVDDRSTRVPFDDKIKKWIPAMAGGDTIDLSDQPWEHFRQLRRYHDDENIHPKSTGFGISLQKARDTLNLFPLGCAALLFRMHIVFDEIVPSLIIRCMHLPEIIIDD